MDDGASAGVCVSLCLCGGDVGDRGDVSMSGGGGGNVWDQIKISISRSRVWFSSGPGEGF